MTRSIPRACQSSLTGCRLVPGAPQMWGRGSCRWKSCSGSRQHVFGHCLPPGTHCISRKPRALWPTGDPCPDGGMQPSSWRDASAADRGCLHLVCVTDGCHSQGCVPRVPPCKPTEPGLGRMAALGCADAGRLRLQVWDKISAWPLALLVAGWTFLCSVRRCRPALRLGAARAGVSACCCHERRYPRALPIQKNVGRGGRRGV